MLNPAVHEPLATRLVRIYAPRSTLTPLEWAEKNIVLTAEESRERSGPYRATPAAARLFQFLNNPAEREFIPKKSSQPGITLTSLLGICWRAATNPTHTLYAMDSLVEAKNISIRLKRLLKTNPALDGTFQDDGEDELQSKIMYLRGMTVWFVGSGARGAFANKSAGLVVMDELDLHQIDNEFERTAGEHSVRRKPKKPVSTIDRGRERLKKITDSKLIAGGKPEGWWGETNQNFLTGTREEIHVPCPRCNFFQPIRFEQLRYEHCRDLAGEWDLPKVIDDTFLECVFCHGRIDDHEKPAMLRDYRFVPTNVKKMVDGPEGPRLAWPDKFHPVPGRVSVWINDMTETDDKSRWGNIVSQFLDADGSPSKLTTFFHGVLAAPREEKNTELTAEDVRKLCGLYAHGVMPQPPARAVADQSLAAVFMAVDKQATHFRWSKVGFRPNDEGFIVDYGRCLTFEDLHAIAAEPVWVACEPLPEPQLDALKEEARQSGRDFYALLRERHPDRPFVTVNEGVIDEGFSTWDVRDFCLRSQTDPASRCEFFPCKGVSRSDAKDLVRVVANEYRTKPSDTSGPEAPHVTVVLFNDDGMKQELYVARIAEFDKIAAGKARTPRLWLPKDSEEDYVAELSAERRALQTYKGKTRMVWLEPDGCNDGGDTVKLALVHWEVVKHRYKSLPAAPPAGRAPAVTMDDSGRLIRTPQA